MDILAHALWAGAAAGFAARRRPVARRDFAATATMAALPDLLHLLPVVAWALAGSGTLQDALTYALARPGEEPALPGPVALVSHHLHCAAHSAPVAVLAGGLAWVGGWHRALWGLLGWWSHIVIDVFTHSAEFYAVPVLYPFTYRGFDGIAWNQPWLMVANYAGLALAYTLLARTCETSTAPPPADRTMPHDDPPGDRTP